MEELFFKPIDPKKTKGAHIDNQRQYIEERQREAMDLLEVPQIYHASCIVCGNPEQKVSFTSNGFPWIKCGECGHMYKQHMPDYDLMVERFKEHTVELYLDEDSIHYRLENITKPKYEFMKRYITGTPGRWLDLATGLADLPSTLIRDGWHVDATEINASFIKYATDSFGFTPHQKTLPEYLADFKNRSIELYDVVGAFGYFDMLPNPVNHIKIINKLLKMDGLVGINIPHCESLTGALAEHMPHTALRPITSIDHSYFSKNSIFHMLKLGGFEVLGMWWHGLDIHELIFRMQEMDPTFAKSKAKELLYSMFNELQTVIDEARMSDTMLLCARKVKDVD